MNFEQSDQLAEISDVSLQLKEGGEPCTEAKKKVPRTARDLRHSAKKADHSLRILVLQRNTSGYARMIEDRQASVWETFHDNGGDIC